MMGAFSLGEGKSGSLNFAGPGIENWEVLLVFNEWP